METRNEALFMHKSTGLGLLHNYRFN